MTRRLIWSGAIGTVVAVVTAIMIAISDLYLSGHGLSGIAREAITWPRAGVHLSIGDIIVLSATSLSSVLAWWTYER